MLRINAFQSYTTLLYGIGRAEEPHQENCCGEESHRKSKYQELHHLFFTYILNFLPFVFRL